MKRLWILCLPLLWSCEGDAKVGDPKVIPQQPPEDEAEFKGLSFDAPNEWIAEKPSNMLRKAQYQVQDKDGQAGPATMVYFGEMGGTVEENVGRWKASVAPDDQGASPEEEKTVEAGPFKVTVVDMQGTYSDPSGATFQDYRVITALAETPGGNHMFKFYGPRNTVADWTAEFEALLKSLREKR